MHRLAKGVENNRLLQESIALQAQIATYIEAAELSDQLREGMETQIASLSEENKLLKLQAERLR